MPLFSGQRDMLFFHSINKEIISDIIETYVDVLKRDLNKSSTNMYGEGTDVVYNNAVRLTCLIEHDNRDSELNEFGKSTTQTSTFAFLRDDLVKLDLYVQEGDIVFWNETYWEISHVDENQFFGGHHQDRQKGIDDVLGEKWGWSVSIICSAHMTTPRKIDINPTIQGNNNNQPENYL